METSRPRRHRRLRQVAACIAAALVAASHASGDVLQTPPNTAHVQGPIEKISAREATRRWNQPDPFAIARRWQPPTRPIPELPAGAIVVQNCNDAGSGSLRQAFADANAGDTIDLTQLSCSTITLTSGAIHFTQTPITLQGPAAGNLSISGNDSSSVLRQDSMGSLYLNDLTIEHGVYGPVYNALGGCIYAAGNVTLSYSIVASCLATSSSHRAAGGGVFGGAGVTLLSSGVMDSSAFCLTLAKGGGVYSQGFVHLTESFVSGNYARQHGGGSYSHDLEVASSTIEGNSTLGFGGGIHATGNASVTDSTIASNIACGSGGLSIISDEPTDALRLINSTVSGNVATCAVGGAQIGGSATAQVANSTIAFNYEKSAVRYGGGLFLYGQVDVESTLIAGNTNVGGNPDDVSGSADNVFLGSHNLVGYSAVPAPLDTIVSSSPRLGTLANNGGPTRTHMLLSGSPAIDAGSNLLNAAFDQRGPGYPRTIGVETDIGAVEVNTEDTVFADGFDS